MLLLNPLPQRLDSGATPTFAGLLAGDGTAAAPSMSFAADTDTGFYRVGANEIGFTANGTRSFTLSTDGVLKGVQGANYLEMNGTGRINLVAGGTAQNITLTPSGTGQVSHIGLSNFTDTLFFGNSSGSYGRITWGSALTFQAGAGLPFTLVSSNGTEVARGFANGRFGIGTGATDSGALLQVGTNTTTFAGGVILGTDTAIFRASAGEVVIANPAGGVSLLSLGGTGGRKGYFYWDNASSLQIVAEAASTSLVFKSSNTTALTLDTSQNATFAGSYLYLGGGTSFYFRATGAGNGLWYGNNVSADLAGNFSIRNAAGSVTNFSVDSSGNGVFSGTASIGQYTTAGSPAYAKGKLYFDVTLNKLRVGGATGWETITSV